MYTETEIRNINDKLISGDKSEIARRTGITKATVSNVLLMRYPNGRSAKPVLEEAVRIIEERRQQAREMQKRIE